MQPKLETKQRALNLLRSIVREDVVRQIDNLCEMAFDYERQGRRSTIEMLDEQWAEYLHDQWLTEVQVRPLARPIIRPCLMSHHR